MSRGRQNLPRQDARAAGLKTFDDPANPCFCGCTTRYVVNCQCVDCMIAKGKARYAAMSESERAELKAKDRERYIARLAAGRAPT